MVTLGRDYFGDVPLMINYTFSTTEYIPSGLNAVGVDPYYFDESPTQEEFNAAVLPQFTAAVNQAKAQGKWVVLLARSFSTWVKCGGCGSPGTCVPATPPTACCPQACCPGGTCDSHFFDVTDRLLTAEAEGWYYDLAQGEPQVVALLWAWVFHDFWLPQDYDLHDECQAQGQAVQCSYSFGGVLRDSSIGPEHAEIGQEIITNNVGAPYPTYSSRKVSGRLQGALSVLR